MLVVVAQEVPFHTRIDEAGTGNVVGIALALIQILPLTKPYVEEIGADVATYPLNVREDVSISSRNVLRSAFVAPLLLEVNGVIKSVVF